MRGKYVAKLVYVMCKQQVHAMPLQSVSVFKALLFVTTPQGGKLHVMDCPVGKYDSNHGEIVVHSRVDAPELPAPFFTFSFVAQHTKELRQNDDEYLNVFLLPLNVTTGNPRYTITATYVKPDLKHIDRISKEWAVSKEPVLEKCASELAAWIREKTRAQDVAHAFV